MFICSRINFSTILKNNYMLKRTTSIKKELNIIKKEKKSF
jgi:hypothetical protein